MNNFLSFGCLMILLCTFATADQLDDQIDACNDQLQKDICIAKVLIHAIKTEVPPPPHNGEIYCQCISANLPGGANAGKVSLYFSKNGPGQILAENLSPGECLSALRYPPCMD